MTVTQISVGNSAGMSYGQNIAEGYLSGHTPFSKLGYSPASTASETTLWAPGTQYVFPVAAQQMEVVSTDNTNDKAAGTGCLTVGISYLDGNYVEKTTTVTLNGTTAVATSVSDILRINYFYGLTFGSTGKAAGTISIRNLDHTTVYGQISAGYTLCRSSVYTVPAGKTLYLSSVMFSAAGTATSKSVRMIIHGSRNPLGTIYTSGTVFYPMLEVMQMDGSQVYVTDFPLAAPATTDLKVSVIGVAAAICTSELHGWLEVN